MVFTYKRRSITSDCYSIILKARRPVRKALLQYYPTQIFIIPQSITDSQNQGFSFEQILNSELDIPIPTINANDPYLLGQQQNDLNGLNQDIENMVRHFMNNSPVTRYSDTSLVVMRIDRAD